MVSEGRAFMAVKSNKYFYKMPVINIKWLPGLLGFLSVNESLCEIYYNT